MGLLYCPDYPLLCAHFTRILLCRKPGFQDPHHRLFLAVESSEIADSLCAHRVPRKLQGDFELSCFASATSVWSVGLGVKGHGGSSPSLEAFMEKVEYHVQEYNMA